jgi:hypothetical protein
MSRQFHPIAGIILLCLPGMIAVAIDGYFGFPIVYGMFTDAIGTIETYVLRPMGL